MNINITRLVSFFTLTAALLFTGCASLDLQTKQDIRTTVRIATVLYINDDPERAEDVLFVVRETRDDINSLETVSIAKAADFVRENIIWQELSPLEAVAVEGLLARLRSAIREEIEYAEIPPETLVLVRDVLEWIEDAVQRTLYSRENY
mgnify:CR=1 FL=1